MSFPTVKKFEKKESEFMKLITFDKYQELIDLIPKIQEAALKGVERDLRIYEFNSDQMRRKIELFKQIVSIIQGKWTIDICFWLLMKKECGFNELKGRLGGISTRTLTDRLRSLEKAKIVKRIVKTESPLRVNYNLTDFGREEVVLFVPVLLNNFLQTNKQKEKYMKGIPNINEIQESAKDMVDLEKENESSESYLSKGKEKVI